jgi:hypothetical protein
MAERTRHAAQISPELLAQMLDFKGAIVHQVHTPDEIWKPSYCCMVIEHPARSWER